MQVLVSPRLAIGEMAIPIELQKTLRGEQVLAFGSGPSDPDRFVIFTTEETWIYWKLTLSGMKTVLSNAALVCFINYSLFVVW